jgi:hypothetical protein
MNPVFDRQSASGRDAAVVTRGDVNLNAQSNQKLTSSRNDGIDGAVAKEPAKVKKNLTRLPQHVYIASVTTTTVPGQVVAGRPRRGTGRKASSRTNEAHAQDTFHVAT